MDREKAADLLDNLIGMVEDNHGADYDTALKIGIEALSTSGDGPEPVDDTISRQAAIDIERRSTVDTNPKHFESHQKFVEFMDDAEISSFGRWQWSNGFNTALTAVGIDLKRLPSAQPEPQWIPVVKKPIEKGLMLVTYNDGDVDLLKQPTAYRRSDIVAWMPIEPWRGES